MCTVRRGTVPKVGEVPDPSLSSVCVCVCMCVYVCVCTARYRARDGAPEVRKYVYLGGGGGGGQHSGRDTRARTPMIIFFVGTMRHRPLAESEMHLKNKLQC